MKRLTPTQRHRLLGLAVVVIGGTTLLATTPVTARVRRGERRANASAASAARELTQEERASCITSMARVEVDTPHGLVTGSGTVIDPRGYVLTNFHVVGHRNHNTGTPGVLRAQRYRIALARTERGVVEDEYEAEVVRGHVRLDLALLHIVERIDGAPITEEFHPMPIAEALPALSTPVWALGYPVGVRTIHITAGQSPASRRITPTR